MLSGRKALKSIDNALHKVRNEAIDLDDKYSRLAGQVALSRRQKLDLLNQIARVRLSEIESGQLADSFNAADAKVGQVLKQRDIELSKLHSQIDERNSQIEESEILREQLLAQVNEKSNELVALEASVQQGLKQDPDYLALYERAKQAESIAEEAFFKVDQANKDMAEKAKPYQDDALFMYLWERGFGTTEYSAGIFGRFMDGWVAKVIKYEAARSNYWNLVQIPQRLNDHSESVSILADEALMALQHYELDVLDRHGKPGLESQLTSLRGQLDLADDTLESHEDSLNQLLSERASFSSAQDRFSLECLELITNVLKHKDLASIYSYVAETHSPVDDTLVHQVQEIEDTLESLEGDLSSVRRLHDSQLGKLQEIESVRQQFKNSRFDDVRSGFTNGSLIDSVISEFINGLISGSDLWGTLKRHQRYRDVASIPDFGSGGIGDIADILGQSEMGDILRPRKTRKRRQNRGSSWHIPSPRRNGGGFKLPRAPRKSGGGFKTGGGF